MLPSIAASRGHAMADDDKPKEDVQSFIFERELAEVYLLLDFLSGRSDKNLSTAFNGADMPPVMSVGGAVAAAAGGQPGNSTNLASAHAWIGAICQIKWPPPEQGGKPPTAAQATTLLLAKDHLNNAAQPANGLSIAFSLMVAGDDDGAKRKARKGPAVARRALPFARVARPAGAIPTSWRRRSSFRHWMTSSISFLFVWLFVTCLLSWNVAIGPCARPAPRCDRGGEGCDLQADPEPSAGTSTRPSPDAAEERKPANHSAPGRQIAPGPGRSRGTSQIDLDPPTHLLRTRRQPLQVQGRAREPRRVGVDAVAHLQIHSPPDLRRPLPRHQ